MTITPPEIALPESANGSAGSPLSATELEDLDRRHLIRSIQNGAITERVVVAFEVREAHGVIARAYGQCLVLAPPLIFTEEQAQRSTAAVVEVLSRLRPDGTIAAR